MLLVSRLSRTMRAMPPGLPSMRLVLLGSISAVAPGAFVCEATAERESGRRR
jgi:hypothetical protein